MTEKILLVENEENLLRLYQMELEEEGYNVVTVTDGQEALEIVNNEPVDLVVLELELPSGSGLNYLQNLLEANRNVKVVINTAYPTYKMDFRTWTADAFLTKSSDLSELKETIRQILNRRCDT